MNETLLETQTETKPMNSSDKAGSALWNQPDLHSRLQSAHDAFVAENPGTQRVSWASIFEANPSLKEAVKIVSRKEMLNFHTWTYTHLDRSLFLGRKRAPKITKRPQVRRAPRNEAVAAIASILKEDRENHEEDIPFVDNKGIVCLRLPGSMTIGQMVRLGLRPSLGAIHAPIPDGVVVHVPKHYPNQ